MARAQSQFLRIYSGSVTYNRWQSYYVNTSVTWEGASWAYQPFDADGITAGKVESESSITVTLPATTNVIESVLTALDEARLVELRMYEFDTILGNATPQAGQNLIASYVGEVVGAKGSFTSIEMELGSSLSPVGAQVPPRKFTTRLIGVPCRL
jgi:phage-related protein